MLVTIIYDSLCPICRTFAAILRSDLPSGWQVIAWEDYCKQEQELVPLTREFNARELQIVASGRLLIGEAAWAYLIQEAPQFRAFQNMAARMGIAPPKQAKVLRLFGTILRNICPDCLKRTWSSR